jgi:hypothetical protein
VRALHAECVRYHSAVLVLYLCSISAVTVPTFLVSLSFALSPSSLTLSLFRPALHTQRHKDLACSTIALSMNTTSGWIRGSMPRDDYQHYKGYASHTLQVGGWVTDAAEGGDGRWILASFAAEAGDADPPLMVLARSTDTNATDISGVTAWEVCNAACYFDGDRQEVRLLAPAASPEESANVTWREGTSSMLVECLTCEASFYNDTTITPPRCTNCPAGYYGCRAGGGCSPFVGASCSPGQYVHCTASESLSTESSSSPDTVSCRDCEPGFYSIDGNTSTCSSCPAGHFNIGSGAASASACASCPVGYYSNRLGSDTCAACPAAKFASSNGSFACVSCGMGSCPIGKFRAGCTEEGGASDSTCEGGCAAGFYGVSRDGDRDGICRNQNWGGLYGATERVCFDVEYVVSLTCTVCPLAYYQSNAGQDSCVPCLNGRYTATLASAQCSVCDSGRYGKSSTPMTSAVHCAECTTGEYQNEAGQTACKSCAACVKGVREGCGGASLGFCAACIPGRCTYSSYPTLILYSYPTLILYSYPTLILYSYSR